MIDGLIVEIIATILNLAYVVLLMLNRVWAWPCGIFGSALMAYTFWFSPQPLYMETLSYLVYTIMGVFGLYFWLIGKEGEALPISEWPLKQHLRVILFGVSLAICSALLLRNSAESRPFFDSFTTIFAMIGTWMQARKILSNWWYWLFINLASIFLYFSTGFHLYAFQAVIFTALSLSGLLSWKRIYHDQKN